MADLVTLADAKLHLHIVGEDRNADVALKLTQASAVVADYLGADADDTWTSTTVPAPVQAAVLIALGHLYENRGEDMKADEAMWSALDRYVRRSKALTFA
jgi:hypothetical protein